MSWAPEIRVGMENWARGNARFRSEREAILYARLRADQHPLTAGAEVSAAETDEPVTHEHDDKAHAFKPVSL